MAATLHVCITCRAGGPADAPVPGERLMAALTAAPVPNGVRIVPVACLSACDTGCAVALSGPGKWSYVYHHLDPSHADAILQGAAAYAAAPDGLVPWRQRPEVFRRQSLARIPPQEPS